VFHDSPLGTSKTRCAGAILISTKLRSGLSVAIRMPGQLKLWNT
jgi:hypothetical protein